jgi:methyl-accepting chemotaxis protein
MSLLAQDPARVTRLPLLSRILIGYGIVGLVGAVIAALLLLLAFGRVSALSDQLSGQVGGVSAVLDKTAAALEDAGATAGSFATTIDTGSAAMTNAANDLRQVVPRLRDLETRVNAVSILGAQPLAGLGQVFGQIADNVTDITTQIDNVAKSLVGNRSALEANARSLTALADQVRTLSDSFASDQLAAAIDSIRWLILALLVIAAIGAAVPAAGALVTGWWLRGWLRAGGAAAPPPAPVSPFA